MATKKELHAALRSTLSHYDRNTCTHEETHRGGYLWTICDCCGAKWADDEGGFKPYVDPKEIADARRILAAGDTPELPVLTLNEKDVERALRRAMANMGIVLVREGRVEELLRANNELLERCRRAEGGLQVRR